MKLNNNKHATLYHFLKQTAVQIIYTCIFCLAVLTGRTALAEDWPTYLHDNHRSGTTAEQLDLPLLHVWVHSTIRTPRPGWTETPALQNFWGSHYDHKSRSLFDQAFQVAVANGSIYFGSSNSGKVICLSAKTGCERWKYITGGPVRCAPSVYEGKIYFGSDDGYVYCLNGADGSLVWKQVAADNGDLMFGNARLISTHPVRTSVIVDSGAAYWGAGLFVNPGRYLCAANAGTGAFNWKVAAEKPMQGYLLATQNNLYVPAGKSTPVMYSRASGNYIGAFDTLSHTHGGCFALLTEDNQFIYGPHYYGNPGSWLGHYDDDSRAYMNIAVVGGNFLIVTPQYSYFNTDTQLNKVNRSTQQIVWSVTSPYCHSLILAGDVLFAGGDDEVAAFSTSSGDKLWVGEVKGRAHGLAVSDGYLYVSTNLGNVHAFTNLLPIIADLNKDCITDFSDFILFIDQWLNCTNPMDVHCEEYLP